jgi:ribosomal-protein-alanine N-acetyltransferase
MPAQRERDSTEMSPEFFLQTQRLGFRHWTAADGALAMSLWGDPVVTRLFGGPFSAAEVEARLMREIAQQTSHGVQYWPIFLLQPDAFVGCCGLRPYPHGERVFEIGFHLCPLFWSLGLAKEAARSVIDHAFNVLGASSLFAGHHPDNESSARLLKKLGFSYERHEFYPPTGLEHPSYSLGSAQRKKTTDAEHVR